MQLTLSIHESADGWLVGQVAEIPNVFSQGRTESELFENIQDAFHLTMECNRDRYAEDPERLTDALIVTIEV